ncbi:hypothetical protein [Geodermatophilus poikilotrophus]|uniref:EcsC protein family protein n=1 Tax=Geodermatophilus poikilotrophus TaxID=1333667 RepID=A0A1I0D2T6_9ACTN|nr:hypothetical protein [Geodermatophilus poikilotrophus]SET26222.1 hypothetical protein SAMN04488546_1887 [Geodermatophilus poikilotrophus]
MTDHRERTGPARDVPPPRPVAPGAAGGRTAPPAEEGPLARAGRLLAEAASGLVGGTTEAAPDGRRSTAATLRDVITAVASAGRGAAGPGTPRSGPDDGGGSRTPGALLGDLLTTAAPRLPIRDAGRLRAVHPGASDDEIADALVARAAKLTAGIGAATGGLSAAHWVAPPSLLALPLELGAETVLTAAVELVLLGELHELYGRPAPGDARDRALAYLSSWTRQRAVEDSVVPGLGAVLGSAGLRTLSRRMTRRMARSVPGAAPFLVGAALGGRANRKATEALARRVLADLRRSRS